MVIRARDRWPDLLWGAALPLAALSGVYTFLLLGWLLVLSSPQRAGRARPRWAEPYLLVIGGWALVQCAFDIELLGLGALFSGEIWQYWRGRPFSGGGALLMALHWLLFFWLFQIFRRYPSRCEAAITGLLWGLGLAAVLTAGQIMGLLPFSPAGQSAYWDSLQRFAGTFSDPNAFGLTVALLLPLLAARLRAWAPLKKRAGQLLMGLWLLLGFFSGSRTYVLALLLYGLAYFWLRKRRLFYAVSGAAVLAVLLWNGLLWFWPQTAAVLTAAAPTAISRTLATLSYGSLGEAWYSRGIFNLAAIRMWWEQPLGGVGFNRFPAEFPAYAAPLGLSNWTDNANNFYLGILAELGLLGLIALVWSLSRLGLQRHRVALRSSLSISILRVAVAVMALLLLFGPHLNFPEVAGLFALLSAPLFSPRGRPAPARARVNIGMLLLLAAVLVVAVNSESRQERGLYPMEQSAEHSFRWTSRRARIAVACREEGSWILPVRALNPDLAAVPLQLWVITTQGEPLDWQLTSSAVVPLTGSCLRPGEQMHIRLELSRAWRPQDFNVGTDPRSLGLQLISPE